MKNYNISLKELELIYTLYNQSIRGDKLSLLVNIDEQPIREMILYCDYIIDLN